MLSDAVLFTEIQHELEQELITAEQVIIRVFRRWERKFRTRTADGIGLYRIERFYFARETAPDAAAGRGNPLVKEYFLDDHPTIFKLLTLVCDAAGAVPVTQRL